MDSCVVQPNFDHKEKSDSLKIAYESDGYLVVQKQYDLHINSDNPDVKVTLQTQLQKNFPHLVNDNLGHQFHFCHRLDYATSGLICIAKTKKKAADVAKAFQKRTSTKIYIAIVRNIIKKELIDIQKQIGEPTDPEEAKLRVLCDEGIKQRKSHTKLLLLQTGTYDGEEASKVLLLAVTGRRHQLRAHTNALGHTIVGDFTYSNRQDTSPHRMMLHAYKLIIPTPDEKVKAITDDPFREEIETLWKPTMTFNKLGQESIDKLLNIDHGVR